MAELVDALESESSIERCTSSSLVSCTILNKKNFADVRKILLDEYQNKTSSNEAVKEILYGDIYDTNRDVARYLLCSLCKFEDKNEKKFIDLWEKKDDKYIWAIEHILPEGNKDATNTSNE